MGFNFVSYFVSSEAVKKFEWQRYRHEKLKNWQGLAA